MTTLAATLLFADSLLRQHFTPISQPTALSPVERAAIKKAIGKSRVVMLGELTHGDGTAFQLKAAFVRFLHEEMDFDVLIWESGLYDCEMMDRELGGTKPLREVAQMGVFPHWSQAAESFPVFEYARATRASKDPLHMAGFDIQSSGSAGNSMLLEFPEWLGDKLPPEDRAAFDKVLAQLRSANTAPKPQAALSAAMSEMFQTAHMFVRAYERNSEALNRSWGKEAPFRAQALKSAVWHARMMAFNGQGKGFPYGFNVREQGNYENLRWLLNTRYAGKKAIVWAHNMHIFKGVPTQGAGAWLVPGPKDIDSMGRMMGRDLGADSYVIGVFAHSGRWSWLGNPEIAYVAPKSDGIEARLHALNHPYAFLNLRGASTSDSSWLRKPQWGTAEQQNTLTMQTVWPKAFDGILYVDEMKPRTQMR